MEGIGCGGNNTVVLYDTLRQQKPPRIRKKPPTVEQIQNPFFDDRVDDCDSNIPALLLIHLFPVMLNT
jgi:hypothetical protein